MTQRRESRIGLFVSLSKSNLVHKKWLLLLSFGFYFYPYPPAQRFKEKARKRAWPPSRSTEKETLFDVSGLLVQVQDPCWFLPRDCPGRIFQGMPQALTLPKSFQLPVFLKTWKGYKLSFSNLATRCIVASNKCLGRTGWNRLIASLAHFPGEMPQSFPEATSSRHSLDRMYLPIGINSSCQPALAMASLVKQWLHPSGLKNPLSWKPMQVRGESWVWVACRIPGVYFLISGTYSCAFMSPNSLCSSRNYFVSANLCGLAWA